MSKTMTAKQQTESQTISLLVEIGKLDTLYRDLYLQRARELMDTVLPYASYTYTKESIDSMDWTERQLRASVERGDWKRAREITERLRTIKAAVAENAESMMLGTSVYEGVADIPIDPFSPGFHVFVGASKEKLDEWRHRAITVLNTLERTDPVKIEFYARRAADFKGLVVKAPQAEAEVTQKASDPSQLREEALTALESGDLTQLDSLVQKLMQKPEAKQEKKDAEVTQLEETRLGDDLLYSFSEATLAAARDFGLKPVRTRSRRHFAYLLKHGWQPSFRTDEIRQWSKEQLTKLTLPSEAGSQAREAIEFFLLNPFINSGGTRYQVCLVVEDLLLEDFAEVDGKQTATTKLLSALGLDSRWGLSRTELETALLLNGPRIVSEDLKLNPEAFRLVSIPADIYTHLGAEHSWGQKEMWTHFDGYRVLEGGKLQALAGGDIRFGGTHDIVSFSKSYTSSKILARFAVVQRKRMMSWHRV